MTEAAVTEAAVTEAAVTEAAVTEAAVTEAAVTEAAVTEAAVTEAIDRSRNDRARALGDTGCMTEQAAADEVLYCDDLDRAMALFARLGFRLETIFPADDPAIAALSGHDTRVRLVRTGASAASGPGEVPATRPSYVVTRPGGAWSTGRAGMQYRDLIPDRQGGKYIASHIRIPDGGPVPDYVHFHVIQFQIIYCYRGWVRVVYEDQGDPFVMTAGECVLQPPRIRHRVLEASPGLEVIEVGVPAVHATHVDHERTLPTGRVDALRDFGGQRFVRYLPARARFEPAAMAGFEASELGIAAATAGLASVRVLRLTDAAAAQRMYRHAADLVFHFVLRGGITLDGERLAEAGAFVVPAGRAFALSEPTADLELLQVALPGEPQLERVG